MSDRDEPSGGQSSRGIEKNTERPRRPFVPLALLVVSLLGWSGFQAAVLYKERDTLMVLRSNQEASLQRAQKFRAALDSLATEMAGLADKGNPNAKLVVEELRKRGITIATNPTSASAPARAN